MSIHLKIKNNFRRKFAGNRLLKSSFDRSTLRPTLFLINFSVTKKKIIKLQTAIGTESPGFENYEFIEC